MGIWKRLFGGGKEPRRKAMPNAGGAPQDGEAFDAEALVDELRAEGAGARAGEVDVKSSPKQVCRYVFVRLMAGTPAAQLRADLVRRGFAGKVADAYITLIQQVMFRAG